MSEKCVEMDLTPHSREKINVLFNAGANFPVVDLFSVCSLHKHNRIQTASVYIGLDMPHIGPLCCSSEDRNWIYHGLCCASELSGTILHLNIQLNWCKVDQEWGLQ